MGKLFRILVYLRINIQIQLTLIIDSINVVKWRLDELFAAYKDAKGQTGANMSMWQGSIIIMSKKKT